MKKNVIIGAVVSLLIIGGLGFYFLSNDTNSDGSDSINTTGEIINSSSELGIDISTLDEPYRVTISTSGGEDNFTGAVEYDGKGNMRTTYTEDGDSMSVMVIEGVTYSKSADDDNWIKFPSNSDSDDLAISSNGLSREDISAYNNNDSVVYIGKESCHSGSCRVYEIKDDDSKVVLRIDDNTNRISEVEDINSDGETSKITYEYDSSIKIEVPTNVTDMSVPILY